jgi:hypothetical protein
MGDRRADEGRAQRLFLRGRPRARRVAPVALTAMALFAGTLTARAATAPAPRQSAPATSHPRLLSTTAGSNEFTVQASSMDVTNLAFTGAQTVTSGTATLTVLRFTADGAVLTGLVQSDPCVTSTGVAQHWRVVESTPSTGTTTLTGPVALLATSLSFTPTGGPTVTFDAATLPPVGVLVPAGTLPQVEITATSLVAAAASAHNLTTVVVTC